MLQNEAWTTQDCSQAFFTLKMKLNVWLQNWISANTSSFHTRTAQKSLKLRSVKSNSPCKESTKYIYTPGHKSHNIPHNAHQHASMSA